MKIGSKGAYLEWKPLYHKRMESSTRKDRMGAPRSMGAAWCSHREGPIFGMHNYVDEDQVDGKVCKILLRNYLR